MSNVESIGERLYRKVRTPVYTDDRKFYTCGCIVHGENGAVRVEFYRYEYGKGIIGRAKPGEDMARWLKQYGRDLKAYVNRLDEIEAMAVRNSVVADGVINGRGSRKVTNRVTNIPHPGSGSDGDKETKPLNNKGQRNLLTNEK